jgi:hypothetical protein
MLRLMLAVALVFAPGAARACSYPYAPSFHEAIQGADQIYIFRIDSLAQVKDRVVTGKVHRDGKPGAVTEADEYIGRVAGRITVLRVLRGKPQARFITFSTSRCGGLRLDVGHYFLVATSSKGHVLAPVPADRSIIDLQGTYFVGADSQVNDSQPILRTVLDFIDGKQLPLDFPSSDIVQYTQAVPAPPPPRRK